VGLGVVCRVGGVGVTHLKVIAELKTKKPSAYTTVGLPEQRLMAF
jgi:hypothetical protein